ncbi:MAG: LOG family protein [Calditrichae bacterium]|nr:LOG family protein [Calditrichia bacterium]
MLNRRIVIGVMGSGKDSHIEKCQPLGKWIAESGFHLLTGGGAGVMAAVSQAFCEVSNRAGLSIGIIPGHISDSGYATPDGYPNQWIELPIYTHLSLKGAEGTFLLSRNHLNILSSEIIIVLPGGLGTASEAELALRYNRTVFGYMNDIGEVKGLKMEIPCFPAFKLLTEQISRKLAVNQA